MRIFLVFIFGVISVFATAMDKSVLVGSWGVAKENFLSEDDWWFLCVKEDTSGFLSRSFDGSYIRDEFSSDAVILRDGYAEILLQENAKAVVAAWKAPGSGRLTGQWFVYREDGRLYNMMYFPLTLLKKGEWFSDSETAIADQRACDNKNPQPNATAPAE